jgi:hypothetical protein
MATVIPYNYLNQSMVATALIELKDDDSFYNPSLGHNGFAWDGILYSEGQQVSEISGVQYASWFIEADTPGPYRSAQANFPTAGLVLLSKVALTILDESTYPNLNLWMQFLLADLFLLVNNFTSSYTSESTIGFTPSGLAYADGVISVIYTPDEGASNITLGSGPASTMVLSIDFSQDRAYLDVAT